MTGLVSDQLAESYPKEIRVIHQANAGAGLAREAGRQAARGEFIQHLDSDDLLLPRKFERQVAGLHEHPECSVSYGKTRYRHADGRLEPEPWKASGMKVETMFPLFLLFRWWDTPTPLYRASLCQQAGPWTDLRIDEDWEYDCRIASLGGRLHYCEEFVVEVRDHNDHRLCRGLALDPWRMRERARARTLMFSHGRRANIDENSPEMKAVARELFLLARQCGAAGLERESRELFSLSREASGQLRAEGLDYKAYHFLARILGWSQLGKLACYSDSLRR